MKRFALILSVLCLGPVTGPLLAISTTSFRDRRPLFGLIALACIPLFWWDASAILAWELSLHGH